MEDEQPGVRDLGRNVSDFTHLHATGLSSKAAVVGALEALRAVGMADRSMLTPNGDGTISFHNEADESPWSVTAWGVRALDFARQL